MTEPGTEYTFDLPQLMGTRAMLLIDELERLQRQKKATGWMDALQKIGLGKIITKALTRAEAPELVMFMNEAVAQKKAASLRAVLFDLAAGKTLEITLHSPPS